jgi:hypothetical protein
MLFPIFSWKIENVMIVSTSSEKILEKALPRMLSVYALEDSVDRLAVLFSHQLFLFAIS